MKQVKASIDWVTIIIEVIKLVITLLGKNGLASTRDVLQAECSKVGDPNDNKEVV